MPSVQLSQVKLYYAEKGEGEPLVFLNGLSGDHGYWMGQLRALGRGYRCLAVDNRDVGQSSYPEQPYRVREMAADVGEFLEGMRATPAHVVGLSLGGMIAQELALARPELVKSLVLANTLARADDWFRATLHAFELIRRQVSGTGAFFEAILPWWVSQRFFEQPERIAWLRWLLHQNPHPQRLEGFLREIQATGQHDALDRLSQIRCPVLLLAGEDDNVAPPRYARQMQDLIPKGKLVILPGIGHAPPLEAPEQFTRCLREFLSGLPG